MGPRSIDRGNQGMNGPYQGDYAASMGPRSIDRGNEARAQTSSSAAGLQWGRDQLIAEITTHPAASGSFLIASMGPRSIDRGNSIGCAEWRRVFVWLQWGRDQLIAEISAGRGN